MTCDIDVEYLVQLTRSLIRAAGENPGGTEEATVDVLAQACESLGLDVHLQVVHEGRPNLVATLWPTPTAVSEGQPARGLLFLGHSDVVPAGDGWSVPPFEGVVARGRIIGRGSADMKGGLATVLAAIAAVKRCGAHLAGPVTLVCTVDEEDLDTGIRDLIHRGLPAGHRTNHYAGCIVAEPTDLDVVVGCRGDAYLEIHVDGVPAHSGRPADGRNAIDAASRIVELIRADHMRLATSPDPLLGCATWNVGRIAGGSAASIVAADAHLWVDRRLLPHEDPIAILKELLTQAVCVAGDGIRVSGEVTMQMPGFLTHPEDPFVRAVVESGMSRGLAASVAGWTAACDGGFVAHDLKIPTVVLGPGSINDQAHQADESVAVTELLCAGQWYADLILRVCTLGYYPAQSRVPSAASPTVRGTEMGE